jgi:YVTN family beta-propeller protein
MPTQAIFSHRFSARCYFERSTHRGTATSRARRVTAAATSLITLVTLLALVPKTTADGPAAAFANLEPAQTNPIRLSADGTRLFAVNTANNSVSVFDVTQPRTPRLLAEVPVGVGPVSANPRTNDEAWVVNQVSNSLSVVSVSKGIVTDTIYTGSGTEPMDVVFAGVNQAYVSYSRANTIAAFDTNSHALIAALPVFGGSPRTMAVSVDGSTVYAAFAISGNATTIIPATLAPPPPPPLNKKLPPPPQVALIVAASDPKWKSYITFKMPDNDVVAIAAGSSPSVSGYFSGVGTVNLGLAVNPVTSDLFVANTDARNLISFQPKLRGHWVDNRITRIQTANGQITPFDLNPNINYNVLPNPAALKTALAQPSSVVFDPSGSFMYVAAFGTDRVAQVDTNGKVLSFVEVSGPNGSGTKADPKHKRGPRGLALKAAAQTLYSLNRISNTISVIDTSKMAKAGEIPVGTDPTPVGIKEGRGFLYDAKLSGNGTGACSSCHVDGDMDHLAWNLGDRSGNMTQIIQNGKIIKFHPMKGPMVTQTLRGLLNLSPYHWRGDFADLPTFNIVFDKLMGNSELSNQDMATYANFLNSILFLPNPYENLDRTLPTSLAGGNPVTGLVDYLTIKGSGKPKMTCQHCHTTDPGPGSNRFVDIFPQQPIKVSHLRNIYQKLLYNRHNAESIDGFGMEHDGNISIPSDLLDQPIFRYTRQQKIDMTSYLLCFDTGTAPAVGYTITLTAANVNNKQEQSDWATLQSQASAANADLIARGTIQGHLHGLLYQPASNNYISDTQTLYTQPQLQALIEKGDTLSFMGVYPGTGTTH